MKCKIFCEMNPTILEKTINEFTKDKKVKYPLFQEKPNGELTVIIFYELFEGTL